MVRCLEILETDPEQDDEDEVAARDCEGSARKLPRSYVRATMPNGRLWW